MTTNILLFIIRKIVVITKQCVLDSIDYKTTFTPLKKPILRNEDKYYSTYFFYIS